MSPFLQSCGLRRITLDDRASIESHFQALREPLAEYSFSQLYFWRDTLELWWTRLEGNLCVFSASDDELTLFLPPIGENRCDRALSDAMDILNDFNASRGGRDVSRVEYVSDELLVRFNRSALDVTTLTRDYVYSTQRMIDLTGGDLASKRQARQRFCRRYRHRTEPFDSAMHADACAKLIRSWECDRAQVAQSPIDRQKCVKEASASIAMLHDASRLNLRGLVVSVASGGSDDFRLAGVTLGDALGAETASILVEKTDLAVAGLAQFIFSAFCRSAWSDREFINVGDDWGIASLAATKLSYRPIKLLPKYVLRRRPATQFHIRHNPAA